MFLLYWGDELNKNEKKKFNYIISHQAYTMLLFQLNATLKLERASDLDILNFCLSNIPHSLTAI